MSAPTFLSYSALRLYGFGSDKRACPYAYHLAYVDRKKPVSFNNRPFFVGHVVHSLQEKWVLKGMNPDIPLIDDWQNVADSYLKRNRVTFSGVGDRELLFSRIVEYGNKVQEAFVKLGMNKKNLKPECELKVWSTKISCFLFARLDLLDFDSWDPYDLKVSPSRGSMDRNQAKFICLILSKELQRPVTKFFQFVPLLPELSIEYEISVDEMSEAWLEIAVIYKRMADGDYEATPSSQKCGFCEYSQFCDASGRKPVSIEVKNGIKYASFGE